MSTTQQHWLKHKGQLFLVYTRKDASNAKVMRRVLRAAYLDQPAGDLSALVNPNVVEEIRRIGTARRKA